MTEQIKVEFAGGHFLLPEGRKRLTVYKEQLQDFLGQGYSAKLATERITLIQKSIRAAKKIYTKIFTRLKHEVLNSVAYLTSNTGVCNVTVDFLRKKLREKKAKFKGVKVSDVAEISVSGIKGAFSAIRTHLGDQYLFARLANADSPSNVIFDMTHPNFPNLMKSLFDIEVVYDSSFLPQGKPTESHEEERANEPTKVPAETSASVDMTGVKVDFVSPIVFNVFGVVNVPNKLTLTKDVHHTHTFNFPNVKFMVSKNEQSQESNVVVDNAVNDYQDKYVAEMINSYLYNENKMYYSIDRFYDIAMKFKCKCLSIGIAEAVINHELRDAMKYTLNANKSVYGKYYGILENKFKALTTLISSLVDSDVQQDKIESKAETNVTPAIKVDEPTVSLPSWFKSNTHKNHIDEEVSNTKTIDFEAQRKAIDEACGRSVSA